MELRKEIEIVLDSLKRLGFERGQIEQELNYSENYIDQVLSKGGNRRFLIQIKKLKDQVLQNPTSESLDKPLPIGDLKITLRDYVNLLEQQKARAEKEKARVEKEKDEYFALIKENIKYLVTNSTNIQEGLETVKRILRADDGAMMDSHDRIEGRPVGTTAKEAGIVERAAEAIGKDAGRASKGRKGTHGKQDS